MNSVDTELARDVLKEAFPHTEVCTQYIARYATRSGKEIALERDRAEALYVWVQKFEAGMPGIQVKNAKFPGLPYERKQARNSNLNDKNAPNLKVGNKVWYLELTDLAALRALCSWYGSA